MPVSTIISCSKCKYTYTEDFERGTKLNSGATSFDCPKCSYPNVVSPRSFNKIASFIGLAVGMAVVLNFILITGLKGEFDTTIPSGIILILSIVASRMIVYRKEKYKVVNVSAKEETEEEKRQWQEIQNWMKNKSEVKQEQDI